MRSRMFFATLLSLVLVAAGCGTNTSVASSASSAPHASAGAAQDPHPNSSSSSASPAPSVGGACAALTLKKANALILERVGVENTPSPVTDIACHPAPEKVWAIGTAKNIDTVYVFALGTEGLGELETIEPDDEGWVLFERNSSWREDPVMCANLAAANATLPGCR